MYYNKKRSKGPDLKGGDKVWLLHQKLKSYKLSKKLDYAKIGPFKILKKISEVNYRLDLLEKIKIYLIQHIAMLELAYGDVEPLIYK